MRLAKGAELTFGPHLARIILAVAASVVLTSTVVGPLAYGAHSARSDLRATSGAYRSPAGEQLTTQPVWLKSPAKSPTGQSGPAPQTARGGGAAHDDGASRTPDVDAESVAVPKVPTDVMSDTELRGQHGPAFEQPAN